MPRRTNAQIAADKEAAQRADDAAKLWEAADIMDAYGVPASANVLRVVADSIQKGERSRA